jgi:hypothetical protein
MITELCEKMRESAILDKQIWKNLACLCVARRQEGIGFGK